MDVTVDGVKIFYRAVGDESNHPLILLHGGPGLDHTELWPWHDPLSDTFFLIYVDMRGQGRSDRVDPATLTLEGFAADVDKIAAGIGLDRFALLGHSYGAFVTLAHAIERGTATHYVISGGTASFTKTGPEVEANLETFEPIELREQVQQSWAMEPSARTSEDFARIMEMQMPFHFARVDTDAFRRYMDSEQSGLRQIIYAPEVLAHFSANGYAIEYEDRLGDVDRPTLVVTGEYDRTCTPRASRDLHAGIPNSELAIIADAGHMTFVEQPDEYFRVLRAFFARHGVAQPSWAARSS